MIGRSARGRRRRRHETAYLRRGLERASGGNNAALLVIYCQENCWMSWNAAKRVLSYGYPNVAWYPEGTEGWERANLPVAEAQPEPRAPEDKAHEGKADV